MCGLYKGALLPNFTVHAYELVVVFCNYFICILRVYGNSKAIPPRVTWPCELVWSHHNHYNKSWLFIIRSCPWGWGITLRALNMLDKCSITELLYFFFYVYLFTLTQSLITTLYKLVLIFLSSLGWSWVLLEFLHTHASASQMAGVGDKFYPAGPGVPLSSLEVLKEHSQVA